MTKLPILGTVVDERFLRHRLRSTSLGGMAGAAVAGGLLLYRHFADGAWSWDLFAVLATMAAVKLAFMLWYRATD
jgi:hypothetical protein